ncbi:HNH endonuclease family protein [Pseudonocardia adelaidensis]|uniref:HNH endonuclease family protein n=1 Tax=Pseudonocardia adelaidensis TaxID=648754 RepID=UPI0031EF670E
MRDRLLGIVLVSAALALTGCAGLQVRIDPAPLPTGDAATALTTLPVKGRALRTGYDREEFGQSWSDVDRNGCDQRNDVLARDLTEVEYRPGTHSCVVQAGTFTDPYSGRTVPFQRGRGTSDDVQIDHVVALANAWQTGAQQLDGEARERFANDPLNLMAAEGEVNQQKGDGDAATWLPPARGFRCAYVARQVAVKAKYRLWVTAAERDAIAGVLGACPGQELPPDSGIAGAR